MCNKNCAAEGYERVTSTETGTYEAFILGAAIARDNAHETPYTNLEPFWNTRETHDL
jgi:hypothetical protein